MAIYQTTIELAGKECPATIEYFTDYPVVGDKSLKGLENVLIGIDSIKCLVTPFKSKEARQLEEIKWFPKRPEKTVEIELFDDVHSYQLSDDLISCLETEIKESLVEADKADRWASYDVAA